MPLFCLTSCRRLLHVTQAAGQAGGQPYDEDMHMAALDLLAGLADGLRASIEPLVAGSALPNLLLVGCGSESTDVRQSAFALLGDLAKACPR
jgi:transportin-1